MTRLHRVLAQIVDEPHREWLAAHAAERDAISGVGARARWLAGALGITVASVCAQIRQRPSSILGGVLMRVVVVTMSLLVSAVGLVVLGAYASMSEHPASMLPFAAVPILQGGFTLLFAYGKLDRLGAGARVMELSGSTLALAVGLLGFAFGAVSNLSATNVDPELAPMTVSLLIAMHGLAALLAFAPKPQRTRGPGV
jgi:hypothetical protein